MRRVPLSDSDVTVPNVVLGLMRIQDKTDEEIRTLVGTALEWYDFLVYGTAAAVVLNQLFFPSANPLIGTLAAFATYAVGFLARPLGGLVLGALGDRWGRRSVLVLTLLIMGSATALQLTAKNGQVTALFQIGHSDATSYLAFAANGLRVAGAQLDPQGFPQLTPGAIARFDQGTVSLTRFVVGDPTLGSGSLVPDAVMNGSASGIFTLP